MNWESIHTRMFLVNRHGDSPWRFSMEILYLQHNPRLVFLHVRHVITLNRVSATTWAIYSRFKVVGKLGLPISKSPGITTNFNTTKINSPGENGCLGKDCSKGWMAAMQAGVFGFSHPLYRAIIFPGLIFVPAISS